MKKGILISFSVIILLLAIVSIISIYNIKDIDDRTYFEKYYDYKVQTFKDENKVVKDADVIFLGDSLTDLCDLNKYYDNYRTVNRGISGDTTTGVLNRLDVSAFSPKTKALVMMIGINNFNNMFDDYESILKELTKLEDTKVIILSLTPYGKGGKEINKLIKEANKTIEELALKYNYTYVDVYDILYNEELGGMDDKYTVDGLHYSDLGYIKLSQKVREVLVSLNIK